MGVRKFRTIEEMNEAVEAERRAAGVDWDVVAHVLAVANAGAPRRLEPGVYKHRTVKEWNAQTDDWRRATIERAKSQRADPKN